MKYFHSLFLCLPGFINPSSTEAQIISVAPDFLAVPTYQAIYWDYVTELSDKFYRGEIAAYKDPALSVPLANEDRAGFMTDVYAIQDLDPVTGEIVDLIVHDTLRGSQWQGIHFDLKYMAIKVNDLKTLYIPNSEKKLLNNEGTVLLEKLQSEGQLPLIGSESIGNNSHLIYNSLQKRIFEGIMDARLPIWRRDSIQLPMSLMEFDTLYDVISDVVVFDPEMMTESIQTVKAEFDADGVSGTCIRASLSTEKDGWHLECDYYGITYLPQFGGFEFPSQSMCWIKREDLKKFLKEEDWLFLQAIWHFTLNEKVKYSFNSDYF